MGSMGMGSMDSMGISLGGMRSMGSTGSMGGMSSIIMGEECSNLISL
jgi:hypothetical protein